MGHILKTLYFATIIILQSISDLVVFPRPEPRSQARVVALKTAMYWLDQTLYRCISFVFTISDIELLDGCCSLRDLAIACVFCCSAVSIFCLMIGTPRGARGYTACVDRSGASLPTASYGAKNSPVIYWDVIPRRLRHIVLLGANPSYIQKIISRPLQRTQRLLKSFDELERDVRGGNSGASDSLHRSEVGDCKWTKEKLQRTFENARKARVPENELTKGFIEARSEEDYRCWNWYKKNCRKRHAWGQYFRSNLDWDSGVTYSMKRMFKLPDSWSQATFSPTMQSALVPAAAPEVVISSSEAWEMSTVVPREKLPKEFRIPYKTKTGEIKYMTYLLAGVSVD